MSPVPLPTSSSYLLNIRFLKWGATQRPLHHRPGHLQDAFPQKLKKEEEGWSEVSRLPSLPHSHVEEAHLEEVEIDLLSVRILLLVNRHEQILHVHHHPQQAVNLIL